MVIEYLKEQKIFRLFINECIKYYKETRYYTFPINILDFNPISSICKLDRDLIVNAFPWYNSAQGNSF